MIRDRDREIERPFSDLVASQIFLKINFFILRTFLILELLSQLKNYNYLCMSSFPESLVENKKKIMIDVSNNAMSNKLMLLFKIIECPKNTS